MAPQQLYRLAKETTKANQCLLKILEKPKKNRCAF